MAVPLNTWITIEQRGVVRFLWAKIMETKDIHKKRTTPRFSIAVHVFRGAAIL
jgi:hypothetical protein